MLEVILRIGSYLLKSTSLADEEQDLDVEGGATLKSPAWASDTYQVLIRPPM